MAKKKSEEKVVEKVKEDSTEEEIEEKIKEKLDAKAVEDKEIVDSETEEDRKAQKKRKTHTEEDMTDDEIEKVSAKITKKDIEEEKKSVDKKETLIPLEDYIKCAVHLGTKVITPHMRKFVYKRRADGLAVINTAMIDEKLREAAKFLAAYDPSLVYICCKREAGWSSAEKFSEITGIRVFTKKYPSGITTNLELEDFFESELAIICDPWIDKNALNDTAKLKKPVLSLCDTNNYTTNITKIIPCNNKSKKSIGCVLFILAREYCKLKKIPFKAKLEDFTGPLE